MNSVLTDFCVAPPRSANAQLCRRVVNSVQSEFTNILLDLFCSQHMGVIRRRRFRDMKQICGESHVVVCFISLSESYKMIC